MQAWNWHSSNWAMTCQMLTQDCRQRLPSIRWKMWGSERSHGTRFFYFQFFHLNMQMNSSINLLRQRVDADSETAAEALKALSSSWDKALSAGKKVSELWHRRRAGFYFSVTHGLQNAEEMESRVIDMMHEGLRSVEESLIQHQHDSENAIR